MAFSRATDDIGSSVCRAACHCDPCESISLKKTPDQILELGSGHTISCDEVTVAISLPSSVGSDFRARLVLRTSRWASHSAATPAANSHTVIFVRELSDCHAEVTPEIAMTPKAKVIAQLISLSNSELRALFRPAPVIQPQLS